MIKRIIYVAPRYHTNQVPIMQGWEKAGVEVHFMAQFEGVSEVHDHVTFHRIKKSVLGRAVDKLVDWRYDPATAETKKQGTFLPSIIDVCRIIRQVRPDLLILRERNVSNMLCYFVAKIYGIRNVVLYNQVPIWPGEKAKGFKLFMRTQLFPNVRFSPVLYIGKRPESFMTADVERHAYFIPLVSAPVELTEKVYCRDGILHLLDIGKYRDYKNHFLIVDALEPLRSRRDIHLTIIGQYSNSTEKNYYENLRAYIADHGLDHMIELRHNIPFREMNHLYDENDILILPSKKESAGMVIMEAMGKGLCVASSTGCGLTSYLDLYACGKSFPPDNPKPLTKIIRDWADNKDQAVAIGKRAQSIVQEHFQFRNYVETLNELTCREFGLSVLEKE